MRNPLQARLRRIATAGALLTLAATFGPAAAQDGSYPLKPIRALVPFSAGSATDIIGRIVVDDMRQSLGQPFVLDNRPGANGFIAAEAASKAPADGYTVLITATTTHSTNPGLFKKLPYDPVKDFAPIGGLTKGYYAITVNRDLPVKSLPELIAYLKANEGKASYGWAATVSQLATVAFLQRIGTTATSVPYKSSPQAATDLMGGQLTFMVQDVISSLGHVKADRVRALAVTLPQRIPDLPNVPTMAEAGLPGFEAESWIGMFAPAGTPEPVLERLSVALQAALKKPSVIQKITTCCAAQAFPSTRGQFSDYLARDRALWMERIKAAGIQPE